MKALVPLPLWFDNVYLAFPTKLSPYLYESGPGLSFIDMNLGVFGFILQNLESANLATANLPFLGSKSIYL